MGELRNPYPYYRWAKGTLKWRLTARAPVKIKSRRNRGQSSADPKGPLFRTLMGIRIPYLRHHFRTAPVVAKNESIGEILIRDPA